jgi:hypothetical protein
MRTMPFDKCDPDFRICVYLRASPEVAMECYVEDRKILESDRTRVRTLVLPDSNEGLHPNQLVKYFADGGIGWPSRTLVWVERRAAA